MPPKKKASEAAAPSASISPPPEQTGGGVDASGRTDIGEDAHGAARSKDKAAQTLASSHPPRPSQETQDHIVMVFAVPYACWTKIRLVGLETLKTSMHANMLARVRHGRLDGILFLLT